MENIPNRRIPQSVTINDFLDEILIHILSFLPIKYVFRTSIISKRWVPLCYSLSDIRFDNDMA
ncbi:F-box protein [Medicago truncatula]|uniref:F-box protein n=1 Tax=Medicago truncatula TaxID=3880 RepID=G7JZ47_MEDTR|nr:F-box protein [Medicago truncatula]